MSTGLALTLEAARTFLFVPADRPERFAKAAASGADIVILDLEDAVAPEHKELARRHAATALASGIASGVRINGVESFWFDDDCAAIAATACVVVLPKSQSQRDIRALDAALARPPVVLALVETAAGILAALEIAQCLPVVRLALGSLDLAAELGVAPTNRVALASARSQLVLASSAARIAPPVDGVTESIDDEAELADDIAYARGLGFTGKLCIHPRQVAPTSRLFDPTRGEVEWAEAVVGAALGAGAAGVVVIDGRMVDRPVVERAKRILSRRRPAVIHTNEGRDV